MMHTRRRWSVSEIETPTQLAFMLSAQTNTPCSGFTVEGFPSYLFLNDAGSENGAQEYAVVKAIDKAAARSYRQVESITFSWCTPEDALAHIKAVLDGRYDDVDYAYDVEPKIEPAAEHEPCPLCR